MPVRRESSGHSRKGHIGGLTFIELTGTIVLSILLYRSLDPNGDGVQLALDRKVRWLRSQLSKCI